MNDCIFCKIIKRKIPSTIVYEDEEIIVINDINPEAPIHLLVIPKEHIENVNELEEKHERLTGKVYTVIKNIAKEQGFSEDRI